MNKKSKFLNIKKQQKLNDLYFNHHKLLADSFYILNSFQLYLFQIFSIF